MQTSNPFPLNAWYAAGWTHAAGPSEITVCNRKLALWRTTDAAAVARRGHG